MIVLIAGCAPKAPVTVPCGIDALPILDELPMSSDQCKPQWRMCNEWRESAIRLCKGE